MSIAKPIPLPRAAHLAAIKVPRCSFEDASIFGDKPAMSVWAYSRRALSWDTRTTGSRPDAERAGSASPDNSVGFPQRHDGSRGARFGLG